MSHQAFVSPVTLFGVCVVLLVLVWTVGGKMLDQSRKLILLAMSTVAGGFQDFRIHSNYFTNENEFVFD